MKEQNLQPAQSSFVQPFARAGKLLPFLLVSFLAIFVLAGDELPPALLLYAGFVLLGCGSLFLVWGPFSPFSTKYQMRLESFLFGLSLSLTGFGILPPQVVLCP